MKIIPNKNILKIEYKGDVYIAKKEPNDNGCKGCIWNNPKRIEELHKGCCYMHKIVNNPFYCSDTHNIFIKEL